MSSSLILALAALLAATPGSASSGETVAGGAAAPSERTAPDAAFAPGEQIDLEVDYLHIRTGKARLVLGKPEGAVWPVICQGQTDGIASLLDIREHYVSYWDSEARVSRGSDLNAIEVGDRHTDRSRFDRENGTATVQVIRKGKARERTHEVPRDVHDLASALLELRMRPLAPGVRIELPVFSGSTVFTMYVEVEGTERIATPVGRFDALRIKVRLGFKDKFRTDRDSHVWVSNDVRHIPLKASADFAVGSVTATLVGYRPGGQLAAAD